MIAASDLRDALSPLAIIERYGLAAKRRGSQYRLAQCPRCGEKSQREAIAIDAQDGSWCHHGYERAAGGKCSGDVLDLLAACEGLDCARDFRRVAELAAQLSGVADMSDAEREQHRRETAERNRRQVAVDARKHLSDRDTARAAWDRLARRDERGESYLAGRGLDAGALVERDAVRFSSDGIVVAIRDVDGCPISTATRRYEGSPKVLALKDHSTRGTMIDASRDIVGGRDVVIVEGVVDALTARLAWPTAVVLGANGAGNVARVAETAIIRIKLAAARLWLVPHDDEAGIQAMTRAGSIAVAAGLELEESLGIVMLPAKDLNEAWSSGWRP